MNRCLRVDELSFTVSSSNLANRRAWRFGRFWRQLLLSVLWVGPALAADANRELQAVDYMIVVTGSELLTGAYPDSHTHFVTRTLRPLGLRCVGSISVDDKSDDIQQALRYAMAKARLVIVTGGLGPTDNDVTREVLSEFTGIALREDPDLLEQLERRFSVPRAQLRKNLRQQIQVPVAGGHLQNRNGTAVGLVFEFGRAVIVALPGPPRELQPMVRDHLVPFLSAKFSTRLPGSSLTLRFVGIGQSRIEQTLKDQAVLLPEMTVSSQFRGGRVDFAFSRPGDTRADRAALEELKREVLRHLGEYVYADDETSLETHVVNLLAARGSTIALAEVGSGGRLAAALSDTDASSRVLAGAYVAGTEEKLRRLLGVPDDKWNAAASGASRTKLLAAAAANLTGSRWALAVGDAEQDQSGADSVEVVLRAPNGLSESHHSWLRSRRASVGSHLTTEIFDRLRRELN